MYGSKALDQPNLYSGSVLQALSDLDQSSALNPKNAYAALWRDIVDGRAKQPSRWAQAVTRLDMSEWPAPTLRPYLNQATREEVLAAADDPNAKTKKGQVCEAKFFIGELTLMRGTKDKAVPLLQRAAAKCGENTFVRAEANGGLKALGAQP
jgi:lipoprotein NlpI